MSTRARKVEAQAIRGTLTGVVEGGPGDGCEVVVWRGAGEGATLIGRAWTDAAGEFAVQTTAAGAVDASALRFEVRGGAGLVRTRGVRVTSRGAAGARVSIEVEPPPPGEVAAAPTAAIAFTGSLRDDETGLPLAGLRVDVRLERVGAPSLRAGGVVSDARGRFAISLPRAVEVEAWAERLGGDAYYRLEVSTASGEVVHTTSLRDETATNRVLRVPLPPRVTSPSDWSRVVDRMPRGPLRVREIACELTLAAGSTGVFADLDTHLRMALLGDLRRAVDAATPAPLRAGARDPGAVAWPLDPHTLRDGGPVVAASRARADLGAPPGVGDLVSGLRAAIDHDRVAYRDYLVSIWTQRLDSTMPSMWNPAHRSPAERRAELAARFHQDFTTQDTAAVTANEVLIPIVTEILTAPVVSGTGYGVPASSIPPRGVSVGARARLDELVGLTGLTAREFGLRHRLDLLRPDAAESSPVDENIRTLQAFYADEFQSAPGAATPDLIIPDTVRALPPFFLAFDEWMRARETYFGENFFQLRRVYESLQQPKKNRDAIRKQFLEPPKNKQSKQEWADHASWVWIDKCYALYDRLTEAHAAFDGLRFGEAKARYMACLDEAGGLFESAPLRAASYLTWFKSRAAQAVTDPSMLEWFTTAFRNDSGYHPFTTQRYYTESFQPWLRAETSWAAAAMAHLWVYGAPVFIGESAARAGDYATAVDWMQRTLPVQVGLAHAADDEGWPLGFDAQGGAVARLHDDGELAYAAVGAARPSFDAGRRDDSGPPGVTSWEHRRPVARSLIPVFTARVEGAFLRLRLGEVMLAWADGLFRADTEGEIARARELYKGVLWLHGEAPPTLADWSRRVGPSSPLGGVAQGALRLDENPAEVSQRRRARLGFDLIAQGLNYFGFSDDMVPILRYRTLKDSADRLAAAAQATEQDYLRFVAAMEDREVDAIRDHAMLKKAGLQAKISKEMIGVADDAVRVAKLQVDATNAAIEAKKREIDDHDSFFGQLMDFVSGVISFVKDIPDDTKSSVGSGVVTAAGLDPMKGGGFLGLGVPGSVMGGFGLMFGGEVSILSGMGSAANKRRADLNTLMFTTLPIAEAQLDARKRERVIADSQLAIAETDAALARDLIAFQSMRVLDVETWTSLSALARRILQRYLDLASRAAWLAERALAYEQDRALSIVALDYFPVRDKGLGGAARLQLDAAELEVARLDGMRETIPVRHTWSLSRDFPLQWAQLKATGRCTFVTDEAPLRRAYPGTYGFRIGAVTPMLLRARPGAPMRGVLTNLGVSRVSKLQGGAVTMHPSVRPSDGLPLSEFHLGTDREIYGLPDGALMPFEGSGVETAWTLTLPPEGAAEGLDALADVLLTADLRARYAAELEGAAAGAADDSRMVFLSARSTQAELVAKLRAGGERVEFSFDLRDVPRAVAGSRRTIRNVFVLLSAPRRFDAHATLRTDDPARALDIALVDGAALSNNPPILDAASHTQPSGLNPFVLDQPFDQVLRVAFDPSQNPGVSFAAVADLVLGVDYLAATTA